jgi:glycerophosphoryl diester phosphodiesterase
MRRVAHRGDGRRARENSLEAIAAAIEAPACDGVEFDVRLSADDVPVVTHDRTLDRVQDRRANVNELAAGDLQELGISTLADVLAIIPRRVWIDIDLKDRHDRTVVEVLAAGRGPTLVNAVISSFNAETLERIGGLAPDWTRWLNADDLEPETLDLAKRLGCPVISADRYAINPASVALAHAAGLDVAAWTVRGRGTWVRLERLGVIAAFVEGSILDG